MSSQRLRHAQIHTFRGDGPPAHFFHANGFSPGVYSPLLSRLATRMDLTALAMRPIWPNTGSPPVQRDWQVYVDDLIAHLEQRAQGPVIGIGHSMGAACTALAAEQRPDLFQSLVLIETVMVTRLFHLALKVMPKSLVLKTQPAKGTLAKRDSWESPADFRMDYLRHRAYRHFDTEAWDAMQEHSVRSASDGRFHLSFPKEWEAHNYTLPPFLIGSLARIEVPCVSIQTRPSVFCAPSLWKSWRERCPHTVFIESPEYSHLLPIEAAEVTHQLVRQGMDALP